MRAFGLSLALLSLVAAIGCGRGAVPSIEVK